MEENTFDIVLENCEVYRIPMAHMKLKYKSKNSFNVNTGEEKRKTNDLTIEISQEAFEIKELWHPNRSKTVLERLHSLSKDIVYVRYLHEKGDAVEVTPPWFDDGDERCWYNNKYQNCVLWGDKLIITIKKK